MTDDDTRWGDALEAIAIENSLTPGKMPEEARPKYVKWAMKKAKVVYAVWRDGDHRICYCIKGANTPEGTLVRPTAFIVAGAESALGMQRDWGDGVPRVVH